MVVALDRHPRGRSLRGRAWLARGASLRRRASPERAFDAGARATARKGRRGRSRGEDGLPDRDMALDGAVVRRRTDGREPWHRLRARRRVRRAARLYVVRDAPLSDALEQT